MESILTEGTGVDLEALCDRGGVAEVLLVEVDSTMLMTSLGAEVGAGVAGVINVSEAADIAASIVGVAADVVAGAVDVAASVAATGVAEGAEVKIRGLSQIFRAGGLEMNGKRRIGRDGDRGMRERFLRIGWRSNRGGRERLIRIRQRSHRSGHERLARVRRSMTIVHMLILPHYVRFATRNSLRMIARAIKTTTSGVMAPKERAIRSKLGAAASTAA